MKLSKENQHSRTRRFGYAHAKAAWLLMREPFPFRKAAYTSTMNRYLAEAQAAGWKVVDVVSYFEEELNRIIKERGR